MIKELEKQIADTRAKLFEKLATLKNKKDILKSTELKSLYDEMKVIPNDHKASYGKLLNYLKN
jgi:vacuolar-type H+-ATPase subunit E/Vma4